MSLPTVPDNIKGPFNVHASVQCKPGSASEFEALLKETVRLSNQEEGTLEYKAGREADKENSYWVYEKYASRAAFEAHGKGDALGSLAKSGLVAGLYLHFTEDL